MNIYPEDFEPDYCARIQEVRSLLSGGPIGKRQYSFLGPAYGATSAILLNLWVHIIPNMVGDFFVAGGTGAAVGYVYGLFADRRAQHRQQAKKVTVQEINFISKSGTDPLRVQSTQPRLGDKVIADQDGLRFVTVQSDTTIPWADITDFYNVGIRYVVVIAAGDKYDFLDTLTDAERLRLIIPRLATNAGKTGWRRTGGRYSTLR